MNEMNTSTLRSQFFLSRSLPRIGILSLYCVLLSGCVGTSNWLSGSSENQNFSVDTSHYLAPMRIGVTPVKEVASRFGVPDDVQFGSIEGRQIESLGYSSNTHTITPFQYIPFWGAVEMWRQESNRTPSAAISFSPEERVTGLTVSSNNAYGDIRIPRTSTRATSSSALYGMNNPAVFHTTKTSPEHFP